MPLLGPPTPPCPSRLTPAEIAEIVAAKGNLGLSTIAPGPCKDHLITGLIQAGPNVPGICAGAIGDRWCGSVEAFKQYAEIACLRLQASPGVLPGANCLAAQITAGKVELYAKSKVSADDALRKLRQLGAE